MLGRVGMGVAVRAGAPVPDISTVEALRRSVLAAESLVFTRGSSGVYFESLLNKLGLYEQVESRIIRHEDGESAMAHVLQSKGRVVSFARTLMRHFGSADGQAAFAAAGIER